MCAVFTRHAQWIEFTKPLHVCKFIWSSKQLQGIDITCFIIHILQIGKFKLRVAQGHITVKGRPMMWTQAFYSKFPAESHVPFVEKTLIVMYGYDQRVCLFPCYYQISLILLFQEIKCPNDLPNLFCFAYFLTESTSSRILVPILLLIAWIVGCIVMVYITFF